LWRWCGKFFDEDLGIGNIDWVKGGDRILYDWEENKEEEIIDLGWSIMSLMEDRI
jgi:hypothetical protein